MNTAISKLEKMKDHNGGSYWNKRIIAELEYAIQLTKTMDDKTDKDGTNRTKDNKSQKIEEENNRKDKTKEIVTNIDKYKEIIKEAINDLYDGFTAEGAITSSHAKKAEEKMKPLSEEAKKYQVLAVAHAHIDMNWMWSYHETTAIVLDTFRTMLDLMKEYPEFTFSQSQASVYKIVEENDPDMLEEIKQRVKEGRWEITATTWVEADKNMSNGESLARHILYTKRYLSKLFDIDPDSLKLDYEPDTFGHSINVPEILSKGGVKYYYHCRGYDGYSLYQWKAPSRSKVIVYREPQWYLGSIEPTLANYVPEFCFKHGLNVMLKVYGVGDHGGGPTRRDIEMLLDMGKWPIYPRIKFGTYNEFFKAVELIKSDLPIVNGELNAIFTGCYTSQSRIKEGNSILEDKLYEAEAYSAIASKALDLPYNHSRFEESWQKVLFSQFHDLLTGSCKLESKEYTMGQYQQAAAITNTEINKAIGYIASNIDTSAWIVKDDDSKESTSEGAGVGSNMIDHKLPQVERGSGLTRIFHLFNSSTYMRKELVEITIWDWEGDMDNIQFKDSEGRTVPHQVITDKTKEYWGHDYFKVLIYVQIPALGYSTVIMTESQDLNIVIPYPRDPRVERLSELKLENSCLKVVFDKRTGAIISMRDKLNGAELIDPKRPTGVFRLITEDDSKGMTSWTVGQYLKIANINDAGVKISNINISENLLRKSFDYTASFGNSSLKVYVYLDEDSTELGFDVECDFKEIGSKGNGVPQLNFYLPVGYECCSYLYDVPSGTINRESMDIDVVANSWAAALPQDPGKKSLMLICPTKHGFRGMGNSLSLSLLRGSYDPDPYPEFGEHSFSFYITLPSTTSNRELIEEANIRKHPIRVISRKPQKGELLPDASFMSAIDGEIVIQAIKIPEKVAGDASDDNNKSSMLIRGYETEGRRTTVELAFSKCISKAYFVDINEKPLETAMKVQIMDSHIFFGVEAHDLFTILVEFE